MGLHTIGDVARWPEHDLRRRFGRHGEDLARHGRGLDERELMTDREAKSVSKETTFARDITDGEALKRTLRDQVRTVCKQLSKEGVCKEGVCKEGVCKEGVCKEGVCKEGVCGTTVKVKVRWPDFVTITRQFSVASPTADEAVLWPLARRLFDQVWPISRSVRLLSGQSQ